ncbi:hypothetical protein ACGFWE_13770 [Streptomyces sp. NPDC048523]|uniref:hypothetical protein n=1 Tax=Streptomyces sp. NPDC048523 TaxID=3365567 RepID=UPI00372247B6
MRRRSAAPGAPTIPGTAVTPPRRPLEDVAGARPVPAVEGQLDLVDFWQGCGLLDDDQREALEVEQP